MTDNILEKNMEFSEKFEIPNNKLDYDYLEFSAGQSMLSEEVRELKEAIKLKDDVEILDGAIDVAVIALNIAYKLFRMKGYNPTVATIKSKEAFKEVIDSNMSKLTKDGRV